MTHAIDEVQAVQTLAEILADKEGGVFISRLDNKDAELCIEILDCVSRHLYMLLSLPQAVSSGHRGARPQTRREAGLLCHAEKTCWSSWATTGLHDYNGKDRGLRRYTRFQWICRSPVRNVYGTPHRSKDYEGCNAGRLPEDKKGEHCCRPPGVRSQPFCPSDFARKSSSGVHYLIRTS